MRTKKLEKYFKDHSILNPMVNQSSTVRCVLYSSDEFHINKKQKTLYIKGVGVSPLPEIEELFDIEWIALIEHLDKEYADLVMGNGNPYDERYTALLPNENGIIVAIPNSTLF